MKTFPVAARLFAFVSILLTAGVSAVAQLVSNPPVILVNGSTAGYYNDALGTILDGSAPQFPQPFGIGDDPVIFPATEPDLAAASGLLGNWLAPHAALNSSWRWLSAIPADWALNTETAIIYEVDGGTQGFTNVFGDFDSDNGIYVWVNGQYRFGARSPGLPSPTGQFEYTNIFLGNLAPGTNRIQILREDSGITSGSQVRITGSPNAASAPTCLSAPSGLVSWWRGEGNAVDATGNEHGTITTQFVGSVTFSPGKVGTAFDFTGSDFVELQPLALTNFTIECWLNQRTRVPVTPNSSWGCFIISDEVCGVQDDWHLGLLNGGQLLFHIGDGSGGVDYQLPSTNTIPLNTYVHVAVTRSIVTGTIELYINGVLDSTFTAPHNRVVGMANPDCDIYPNTIGIGNIRRHAALGILNNFDGLIDEPAIYHRALSAAEIAAIYHADSAGRCPPTNPPPSLVPIIASFTPVEAVPGSSVVISGANFSPVAASNIVYFGAVRADVTTASANSLTVTVPAGAIQAPITVTVDHLTAAAPVAFLPSFAGNGSNLTVSSFAPGQNLVVADGPLRTVIADLDGDGKPDLVEANAYAHNISLFRNISVTGTLDASSFASRVDFPSLGGTDSPRCMTVADVDGDGKLDVLVGDQATSSVVIYRNIATPGTLTTESLAAPISFAAGSYPHGLRVADLNGDGLPEILVANHSGNSISILRNLGTVGSLTSNSFAPQFVLVAGPNPTDIAIADFNADGKPDLVTTAFGGSELSVFRNVATPGAAVSNWFSLEATLPALSGSLEFAVADMDGDAKSDLVVASVHGYAVSVYRNQAGAGAFSSDSFAARVDFAAPGWVHNVVIGDFNGDGKPDLALTGELNSYLAVFQNQSTPGSFTAGSLAARVDYATGWNAWGVAVGDLDGDNRADIVFANSYDDTLTLYRNVVSFGESTNQPPASCVNAPAGLVSWWRGEIDSSDATGGNPGILRHGPAFASGLVGQSFNFSGSNDCVEIPYSASLINSNYTIEAWVKPAAQVSDAINQDLIFGQSIGHCQLVARPGTTGIRIAWQFGVNQFNFPEVLSTTEIPIGEFSHLAGTWDGTTLRLFINGVLNAESNPGAAPGDSGCAFFIGGFYNPTADSCGYVGQFFNGTIDDISFYNRALAANEIAGVFLAGGAGKCVSTNPPLIVCVPAPAGLVSWWQGENNAMDPISGHNGTLHNGVTFTPGGVSQGFGLNGADSYVNIPSSEALKPTGAFAFEAWIKYSGNPGAVSSYCIAAKGIDAEAAMDWALTVSANSRLRPHVNVNGSWHYFDCDTPLSAGTWYHVAMIYDGEHLQGYVNGDLDGSANVTGSVQTSDAPLRLGAYAPVNGTSSKAFFTGSIDEVSFYNRNLSAGELFAIFNAGSAGKCPPTNSPFNPGDGLVAHYPFSGDASDVSGNENHGVPGNAVPAADRFGIPNAAFSFNGQNAAVAVADNPALQSLTSNYTFNAWVRFGSNPQIDAAILMKSAGAGDQRKWTFWRHVQAPPYGIGLLLNRVPGGQFQWNHNDPFTIGQWYMVTFSASAGNCLIAVDGQVVSAQSGNLALPDTTGLAMSIGGAEPGGDQWFNGSLDDIRIYNRTFTSNDIAQLYQLESAQPPPSVSVVPVITSFNPTVTTVGSSVTVSGTNFSPVAASNIVYFGAVRANVAAASSDSLTVTVPSGATHAPITVTVDGLTAAAQTAFTPTFFGGDAISLASFSPRVNVGAGDGPTQTVIADFDGDGKPDLAVTDDYGHTLSIYRNISQVGTLDANSFTPRVVLPTNPANYSPYMLITGDVDGDGRLDLVATDVEGNTVSVFRNQATPGLLDTNSFAPYVTFAVGTGPRAVALADLDRDGRPEIITANYDSSTISILRNTSLPGAINANSLAAPINISAGGGTHGVAVTDLDGDGRLDIATANNLAASLSLFRNIGVGSLTAGSFAAPVTLSAPVNAHFLRAGDLDGDGRAELLLTSYLGNSLTIYRNQADAGVLTSDSFAGGIGFGLGGRGHTTALGDVNGDGKPDIVVDTEIADSIALFQNQSAPSGFTNDSLAARVDLPAGWNAWGSSVGDLDGDGRPDIIFANTYDDNISIYRNETTLSNPPPIGCAPTPTGLVSSWKAEENAVDPINGNHGTLQNGATFAPGEVGQSFVFNGTSSYVAVPDAPSIRLTNELTIEFWVKRQQPFGPDYIVNKGGDWTGGVLNYGVAIAPPEYGNILHFTFAGGNRGTVAIADLNWHHCAVVARHGDSDVVFYVDGVLQPTTHFEGAGTVNLYPSTQPLLIGAQLDPIANYFSKTLIDELSIYNRGLAGAEIQAIFTAGSAGKCPPTSVAPNISQQPQSALVAAYDNWQFDVTATGIPAPTYQWFFGAAPLVGQTNAALLLNNVQPNQAGDYFVIVANPSGSVTSAVATLGVLTFPPTITSQPLDRSVYAGKTVSFTVQATGTAPLRYQWLHDQTGILASTTATLMLPNVQSNHAGFYQVVVSNDYGSATSRLAQLTVTPPPPCAPAPEGVIAWWPGQSNLWDMVGGFDAQFIQSVPPASLLYTTGKVGAALSFNYQPTILAVAAGRLNVNTNSGLTIEGWIRPDLYSPQPIAEWNDGKTVGAGLMLSVAGPGAIEATLTDTNLPTRSISFRSANFAVTNKVWQHVALTYDKSAGVATILVNGNAVVQTNIGTLTPNTSGNVYLGYRPSGLYANSRFRGALDEITLYNRALSDAELQSIISADETGKCPPPPPPCIKPPADIAAWWRGESNTVDSVAGNDAIRIPTNYPVTQFYQVGQVGAAFAFRPPNFFAVPRSEGLDVGTGPGLTVEAWIFPSQLSPMPIVEWTDTNSYGANLWLSFSRGLTVLEANLIDNAGGFHLIRSPINTIRGYSWQHVAVTYDKTTGIAALYSDGNLVTTTNLGFFTPRTHTELQIGYHPRSTTGLTGDGAPPTIDYRFNGAIDELAIYRRALSAAEIRNVARVRPGKCLELPPTISRHPQEQVALEGGTARFDVGVGGTAPFQYQWLLAGEAIAAATNSFLALTRIEPVDAAPYSVLVSNAFGSVTSRVAALTVLPANQCLPTPYGAVAFWRGESNTVDELGSHPAAWGTNTLPAYTSLKDVGKVGTAFRFTGQNHLLVPTNSNLDVGAGGGFTIEGWIKPDSLSGIQPVWDWNDGRGNIGVGLLLGRTGPGMLEVTLTDTNATSTQLRVVTLTTPNFTLGSLTNQVPAWSHVALTFDKATGKLSLFVNGKLVGERTIGLVPGGIASGAANKLFSPVTTGNLHFGWRRSGIYQGSRFRGAMDEMAVYYRALAPVELQAIYVVGANGKCTPAPACQPLASGIVSWWRGESNVLDSVDGNHGQLSPVRYSRMTYTNGVVGTGFKISSLSYLHILPSESLNVGAGNGLTFETWFKPDQANSSYALASWNVVPTQGVYIATSPTRGPNYLEANLVDTSGNSHVLSCYTPSPTGGLIPPQKWTHIAVTYEKASGNTVLFLNGSPVVVTNLGSFTPRTTGNLYLGFGPSSPSFVPTGAMDETTLYNRALSSGEITANYRNVANRCTLPPSIVQQPANLLVNSGSNASFTVLASGSPLLRYQWFWNNQPLAQATNATLPLTNVAPNSIGTYSVRVTNWFGSVLSSNANLQINWPPIANADAFATASNTPATFAAAKLLENDTDVDGDVLSVSMVSSNSGQNGTVTLAAGMVTFVPPAHFAGNDTFTYLVTDGHGGTATGTVMVTVGTGGAAPLNILAGPLVDGGDFVVRFAGIPGLTYTIEAAPSLAGPWIKACDIICPETNQGLGIGIFEFSEPIGTNSTRFYRTIYPPY